MASIYKIIRDNDIHLLNYLIDASTGDQYNNTYSNVHKDFTQAIQQHLKRSGSKYYDINKRSVNGRTALHCAATWNRVEMARALIECPSVHVNLQDRENGWTALHRALYMGNIEIARMLLSRNDIDPSIKDREGFDAFELFNSTIPDTSPKEQVLRVKADDELSTSTDQNEHWHAYNSDKIENSIKVGKGGTDVYTWGHNTNYVLGHADSENRVKPERVHLQLHSQQSPKIMTRPNCVIESVAMSKYHMAILTSEPQLNLLVCGFGRGGRLGTGKDVDTQFTPISVQWPERIVSVALGRDHTIAITASGNVITFGQNNFGQLGYETDNHNKEEGKTQLVPRKIQAQSLKKQPILGAAASRIHSVVYTSTDLFTFGYNQGQLGYHQPDNELCQIIPRKVSMSTNILQVVANDNATAILNSSHDIILLCNYNQQKLFFPTRRFPNNIQVHRSEANFAIKLVPSGTEHMAAVTNTGDVFMWTCRSPHVRQTEQLQQQQRKLSHGHGGTNNNKTVISTPKRIWTVRKAHLAAIDASIGQHGEIVICTLSGHVFIGRPEPNGYKFTQITSIQRCIQVCANSSGAFAAIRSEYQLQPIKNTPVSTLVHDMITSLPHANATSWLKNKFEKNHTLETAELDKLIFKYSKYSASNQMDEKEKPDYNREKNAVKEKYNNIRIQSIHDAWVYSDSLAINDSTLDIVLVVGDKHIYCHSSVLRCRSGIFKQLVKLKDYTVGGDIKIKLNKRETDQKIEIQIDHCQLASVLLLLDFVYADEYHHPMSLRFELPLLSSIQVLTPSLAKMIQKDLIYLSKIFYIPNLIASSQENYYRKIPSIQRDMKNLLEKEKGTDVLIRTKDSHVDTRCHEVILRQRCAFFGKMFKAGSVWVQNRRTALSNEKEYVQVNLEHISKEVMDIILRYIYIDEDGHSLFEEIEKDREESMMYFLLDLLCEADFLLLNRLKSITQSALVRFIKLRSAATIFECAHTYLADSLKESCLQFITVNLPAFLGSSMLDSTSVQLIRDLENYIRLSQIQETPTIPRGNFTFTVDDLYLEVEDPEFSTSIFASTRGDGSVSKYAETLVTLQSEKPSEKGFKDQVPEMTDRKATSPTIIENRTLSLSSTKTDVGKMKKGIRVSLENLESELNSLSSQPRRTSTGWAPINTDDIIESSEKPSLRSIIETEHQPSGLTSKSVKSSVPKKISQKERRKLIYKQELDAATESSSSSSKSVWGKVPTVEVQHISKTLEDKPSDIVKEKNNEGDDRKGKKIYVPENLLDEIEESSSSRASMNTVKDESSFNPVECFGSSFNITPIRRFHLDNKNKQSTDLKKSFQTIQKQQQLEDDWRKNFNPKKNIIKIQKEEQAIEGIAQHYVQTIEIMSGEWFEVRRITTR